MSRDEESNVSLPAPVDFWDLADTLAYFVHNAALILDEYGAELDGFQVKPESVSELSDTDKARVHAASQIISRAGTVQFWVERNDCENAALNMMHLTRVVVELMPMKGLAESAKRSRVGLDKGRAKMKRGREDRKDLCRRIAEEIRTRDTSLSAWSVSHHTRSRLAEDYGVDLSQRQIHRYIKDLWRPE